MHPSLLTDGIIAFLDVSRVNKTTTYLQEAVMNSSEADLQSSPPTFATTPIPLNLEDVILTSFGVVLFIVIVMAVVAFAYLYHKLPRHNFGEPRYCNGRLCVKFCSCCFFVGRPPVEELFPETPNNGPTEKTPLRHGETDHSAASGNGSTLAANA